MKTKTRVDIAELQFQELPVDAGQIVDITYACDETHVYKHSHDRSDRTHRYSRARILARNRLDFQPQNGVLPDCGNFIAIEVIEVAEYAE